MLITAWLLALVCLGIIPFVLLASHLNIKSFQGRNQHYKEIYSKAGSLSEQAIYAIKTIKMLTGEITEENKYINELGEMKPHYYRVSSKVGATVAFMNICFFTLNVIVYWFGSECIVGGAVCPHSASKQEYTPTSVITIFLVLVNCSYMIVLISPTVNGISQAKSAATKIYSIIDRQPKISSSVNAIKL